MQHTSESKSDIISPGAAPTLSALFRERVRRTPDNVAYRHFEAHAGAWRDTTWGEMARQVARWQAALEREPFEPGERVAVLLPNCRQWVMFDQAALGLGLIVVPLFMDDTPDNIAWILGNSGARLLLLRDLGQWRRLEPVWHQLEQLERVLLLESPVQALPHPRLRNVADWLPAEGGALRTREAVPTAPATIVYTSGTTGRAKGVVLSHRNLVWNAYASLQVLVAYPGDVFLSFLPLSHTFERTAGYYLPMMAGSTVAHVRSIAQLPDDLLAVRPTVLIAVPRIFERVYNRIQIQLQRGPAGRRHLFNHAVTVGWSRFQQRQGREARRLSHLAWPLLQALVARKVRVRLGGRLRIAVAGGAPLSPELARVFIALGLPLIHGYGMTEAAPVISANRLEDNEPASVGPPLPDVEVQIAANGVLRVRSPGVMLGYWRDPDATARVVDAEGWLDTGDCAHIEHGRLYITGRVKEILVLDNGKKVAPGDLEMAIGMDPLFEQVIVLGESRPHLCALLVPNREQWAGLCAELGLNPHDHKSALDIRLRNQVRKRIAHQLRSFPPHAQIRRVAIGLEPWTVDNGLVTPTLKLKRGEILRRFQTEVDALYASGKGGYRDAL